MNLNLSKFTINNSNFEVFFKKQKKRKEKKFNIFVIIRQICMENQIIYIKILIRLYFLNVYQNYLI